MTLIAAISGTGLPVLMGDLLISSELPGSKVTRVPTIGDIGHIYSAAPSRVATRLCQKLYVINDGLAIGWTGNHIAARTVVRALSSRFPSEAPSPAELEDFMAHSSEMVGANVELVGILVYEGKFLIFGSRGTTRFTTPHGTVHAGGVGARDLESLLRAMAPVTMSTDANPLVASVATFLGVSSAMISEELRTGNSLRHHYGGGFELVTQNEGRLCKLDDLTYLLWDMDELESEWRPLLPRTAVKVSYTSDVLIVRTAQFHNDTVTRNEFYGVSPVTRTISDSDVTTQDLPNFDSDILCNLVSVSRRSGSRELLMRMHYGTEAANAVRFIHEGWRLKAYEIDRGFIQSLFERVRRQYES